MPTSKTKINLVNFAIPVLLLALLGGCATQAQQKAQEDQKMSLENGVAEANKAQAAGKSDEAISALKAVAVRYPADKTPWVRIAQIKFDAGSYGEAIVNAQEALQRDPADQVADSIVAVSGLRLASKALGDLRTQNALTGTVKTEAQDLTKILRESLGETVLVPGGTPKPAPVAAVRRPAPRSRAAVAAAKKAAATPDAAAPAAAAPAPAAGGDNGNPFGGLK
jgi:tetratricopeptide (TPR) repeat protein